MWLESRVFLCEGLDGVGGLRWRVKMLLQGIWGSGEVRVVMRVEFWWGWGAIYQKCSQFLFVTKFPVQL